MKSSAYHTLKHPMNVPLDKNLDRILVAWFLVPRGM